MSTDNSFRRLWSLGYRRLCPITPPGCPVSERSSFHKRLQHGDDARGKAPGVRWPDGNWSGFDWLAHDTAESDLDRWAAMGAGVGIKTGLGVALIDADTLNPEHAAAIETALEQRFGKLPLRVGQPPKAGYVIRTDEDFQYARVEFGERDAKGRLKDRVEILSEGRQFVAHGTHPKTGKPYQWLRPLPALDGLPYAPTDALMAFLGELAGILPAASEIVQEGSARDVDQARLLGDMALVRKAVEATPNSSETFPTRESWVKYGYAIRGAAGEEHDAEGLALFEDFSARWIEGDNPPDAASAEWGRMKRPVKLGADYLYEIAERTAPGKFSRAEKWFEAGRNDGPLFPETGLNAFGAKFTFTAFDAAAETALQDASRPLIKGVLDQGAMTVLYGESNAGKTFVAMDMAYHVARGLPWAGRRTAALPVLYVAAEGGKGARKRAAALAGRYGPASAFWFLLHPINLLRADADLKPLIASIAATGERFGLIVIDTLSRAMAGGDENASTDMGAMVKHLDALRAATMGHVLVVHHSGKDRARGARGHSLLRAATDTEIEVVDGVVSVTKQRDLDGGFSTGFLLDVLTLGVDGDGDPVTSCVVRLVSEAEATAVRERRTGGGQTAGAKGEATGREQQILDAIGAFQVSARKSDDGVSVADVMGVLWSRGDDASEKLVRKAVANMVAKGLIQIVRRGRYKVFATDLLPFATNGIFE